MLQNILENSLFKMIKVKFNNYNNKQKILNVKMKNLNKNYLNNKNNNNNNDIMIKYHTNLYLKV